MSSNKSSLTFPEYYFKQLHKHWALRCDNMEVGSTEAAMEWHL